MIIKTFENFNDDGYYFEIDEDEYWENTKPTGLDENGKVIQQMLRMDPKEIQIIKDHILTIDGADLGSSPDGQRVVTASSEEGHIFLTKAKDEWYYVRFTAYQKVRTQNANKDYHYKCDQLDGLLEFITDKL